MEKRNKSEMQKLKEENCNLKELLMGESSIVKYKSEKLFKTEVELLRANTEIKKLENNIIELSAEIAKGRQHISHLSRENSSLKRDLEKAEKKTYDKACELEKIKELKNCNYNHNGLCTIGKPCNEVTPNQCMCYKQGYRGGFTYIDTDSIKKIMNVSFGDGKSENTKNRNLEFENDDLKKQVKQLVETVATLVDYMR